jgi:hypothetical protein
MPVVREESTPVIYDPFAAERRLLTLVDVAGALRLSQHTIRNFVRCGRLRPTRICRRLLFTPAEVARFLAASE